MIRDLEIIVYKYRSLDTIPSQSTIYHVDDTDNKYYSNVRMAKYYYYNWYPTDYSYMLLDICASGTVKTLQWFISLNKHAEISESERMSWFECIFERGDIEMAQLYHDIILQLRPESYYYVRYLSCACNEGQINICEWLLSINNKVDIRARDDYVFHSACDNGQTKSIQWLYSVDPTVVEHKQGAFKLCCIYGYIELAQWLYSVNKYLINGATYQYLEDIMSKNEYSYYNLDGNLTRVKQLDPIRRSEILSWIRKCLDE